MIFVTGATGYTGRYVVEVLREAGEELRCLARKSSDVSGLNRDGVEIVWGDLSHPEGLREMLRGMDALISVAHIRFASGLTDACRQAGVSRAVFFSSMWRFSEV